MDGKSPKDETSTFIPCLNDDSKSKEKPSECFTKERLDDLKANISKLYNELQVNIELKRSSTEQKKDIFLAIEKLCDAVHEYYNYLFSYIGKNGFLHDLSKVFQSFDALSDANTRLCALRDEFTQLRTANAEYISEVYVNGLVARIEKCFEFYEETIKLRKQAYSIDDL